MWHHVAELPAKQELIDDLERFVIRYIYCDVKYETIAEVRATKWRALKKKSTMHHATSARLCLSLRHHLERAKYNDIFAKEFQHQNSPITDWPWMASREWFMYAYSFQPTFTPITLWF